MSSLETILSIDSVTAARRLLGCLLVRELDGEQVITKIVETEAYHQHDAASHSYRGKTPRTDVMFGPAGHVYVYFTYGMHYCCNIVTGLVGDGSAVLIRAVEPLEGIASIQANRRNISDLYQLTNGPAKLCQALQINKALNGHDLELAPLELSLQPAIDDGQVTQTTRIGISRAINAPYRFYVTDNPYVSRK